MGFRKVAGVASFWAALVIGAAAAWLLGGSADAAGYEPDDPVVKVDVTYRLHPLREERAVPLRVEDLVGVWTGTWGHDRDACTIEINRVAGDRFYGTLSESGAEVAFEGTFDEGRRRIFFRETKVIKLGIYQEWSLGTNTGTFSSDGRTLSGDGIDKWGLYGWDAVKE